MVPSLKILWERSRSNLNALLAAALLLGAIGCAVAALVAGDSRFSQAALAFAITSGVYGLAAWHAPERMLQPLALVGVTMLLGVSGQTVYLNFIADSAERSALLSGVGGSGLWDGLLVVTAGTATMAVGYLAATRLLRDRPGPLMRRAVEAGLGRPDRGRLTIAIAGLCGIAIVAFAVYAPKVGIHGIGDLLTSRKRFVDVDGQRSPLGVYRNLISLSGVALILAAYGLARLGGPLRSRLGLVGLAALIITLATSYAVGSRSDALIPIAMAALVVLTVQGREPSRRLLVGAAVAGLVAVTLLGALRFSAQQDSSLNDALADTSWGLEEPLASRSWLSIGPTSAVVVRVPEEYPYQYGSTLLAAIASPVPRALWSGKPEVRMGRDLGPPVFGFDERRTSGDPPGLPGELWVNGGLIAVLIGMLIFGGVLRWVDRWHGLSVATGGLAAILYGCLAIQLALRQPASDLAGTVLVASGLGPGLLAALVFARNREQAGGT